jgi:hypothetical protein
MDTPDTTPFGSNTFINCTVGLTMTDEGLMEALIGLFAYDTGCVSSGIHDEMLRRRCIVRLEQMYEMPETPNQYRAFIASILLAHFLNEESLALGYGPSDAYEFLRWLEDSMEQDLVGPALT